MLNATRMNLFSFARLGMFRQLAALTLVLLFFTQTASAQRAWAYVCGQVQLPGSAFTSGNLYSVDLATGTPVLLGTPSCGGNTPSLFAGEFIDGTFYALDNNSQKLVNLSENGSCTEIGNLTGLTAGHTVSGLSHNPATGVTYVLSSNISVTHLYTINLNTGALSFVGAIAGINGGISLMISDAGAAYVIDISTDDIFPINLSTATAGAGVSITENGNPVNLNFAQDADFDCGVNGAIQGVLYSGGGNGRLGTLNPGTGVFTQTAVLGAEICAFSVDCSVVPTMGEWSLLSLALLLLSVGTVFITRKQLVLAGAASAKHPSSGIPFHLPSFAKSLAVVMFAFVTGFAVAIYGFGYEVTAADLPGMLMASPIAAYLLHMLLGVKE